MPGKNAASFDGELMAFNRDSNLIEPHFDLNGVHETGAFGTRC